MAGELRVLAQQLRQLTGEHRCPDADLDPEDSVGRLMTSTRDPSRSSRATRRITPTSRVRVGGSQGMSVEVATTPAETSGGGGSVAMVDVVDTLMARGPPIAA